MAKARNEILEGKYKGKVIAKRLDGKIFVLKGFKYVIFDETNIKDIEVINQEQSRDVGSSVARGIAGGILLGPIGLLAGAMLGKNSNINMVTITFTDGEKSLAEVDKNIFDALTTIKWNLENKVEKE